MEQKNNKRMIWAWSMFDWANSSYNLVITSTVFPAYYNAITTHKVKGKEVYDVSFFGHTFVNTALFSYVLAFAYLLIVVMLPILTSIADYKGNKKSYLQMFTIVGSIACLGLYFLEPNKPIELGMICFGIAAIGYSGGFVFYNSYLPQIATADQQDNVSAKGFTYGYIGSVILQVVCFLIISFPQAFFLKDDTAGVRVSFLLVGLWWIGFSLIPFKILPKGEPNADGHQQNVFTGGFKELAKVWRNVKGMPLLKRYLPAFFFYSVGVQTVMLVAANFGAKILHMSETSLIIIVLIIQLVAVVGAWVFSKMSAKYGNVKALIAIVSIWTVVCIGAYFITKESEFYILATVVGVVMGGVQSLSRSTYSKLIPENIPDTASYFSFYDVTEKLSIVIGLFAFGFIEAVTGSMRNSIIALDIFFVSGLILLLALLAAQRKSTNLAALNIEEVKA
ncbi:MFS transporter [Mucilaginibacter koreensis]